MIAVQRLPTAFRYDRQLKEGLLQIHTSKKNIRESEEKRPKLPGIPSETTIGAIILRKTV